MLVWLVGVYVIVELLLIAASGYVALAMPDSSRRKDAYKVLRLLLSAGAIGGLAGMIIRLHELGLLRLGHESGRRDSGRGALIKRHGVAKDMELLTRQRSEDW